jgi:hypothetical protein
MALTLDEAKDLISETIDQYDSFVYTDHQSHTPLSLSFEVIFFATNFGFEPNIPTDEFERILESTVEEDENTDYEGIRFIEDEAIDWLNSNMNIPDTWWGHDGYAGGFGCWRKNDA